MIKVTEENFESGHSVETTALWPFPRNLARVNTELLTYGWLLEEAIY